MKFSFSKWCSVHQSLIEKAIFKGYNVQVYWIKPGSKRYTIFSA
jgi:hypothetical protein